MSRRYPDPMVSSDDVNGTEVYGQQGYATLDRGPGQVLDSFNRSSGAAAV